MATLGTFTAGQVLTAAELNAIGTWTTWTPDVRSSSGTLGSVTLYYARYTQLNDLVIGNLAYKITNVGTGSGAVRFTLPVTNADYVVLTGGAGMGVGRENQVNGKTVNVLFNDATSANIFYYDNTNPVALNHGAGVVFVYRTA